MSIDRQRVIRFAHNTQFTVESGECIGGPCSGQRLRTFPAEIVNGAIIISADAGRTN
jgi:nitrite reductase/ring-hydroxylating ferredoxin subunit